VALQAKRKCPSKLAPSGVEAIFINYDGHHHTYKLWVPSTNNMVISHHVQFFPQTFPMKQPHDPLPPPVLFDFDALDRLLPASASDPAARPVTPTPVQQDDRTQLPVPEPTLASTPPPPSPVEKKGYTYVPHYDNAPKDISLSVDEENIIEGPWTRHRALVIVGEPSSAKDPKTYGEILGRVDENEWLLAVEVELGNMKRHEVWVVAPKSPGTRELDTVWVFKRKFDADGELLKYKARLCVRGFCQIEGIDYNDTFALTGRLATLCLILGIAAVEDFDIQQMDVRCAFLNGVPKEELFIKVPDGLGVKLPAGHGLKLQRSLYGLKQSPRCWYKALKDFFASVDFQPTIVDPCLFCHTSPEHAGL
jgi:hypothetical protein